MCDVLLIDYSADNLYDCAMAQEWHSLLNEYRATVAARNLFLVADKELCYSAQREWLDGVVMILEQAICNRACAACLDSVDNSLPDSIHCA